MSKSIETPRQIASNKKARHDYAIETQFEAGLVLEGWEIKSIRDGHVQLKESYVILKRGEAWLIGAHIMPLKKLFPTFNALSIKRGNSLIAASGSLCASS